MVKSMHHGMHCCRHHLADQEQMKSSNENSHSKAVRSRNILAHIKLVLAAQRQRDPRHDRHVLASADSPLIAWALYTPDCWPASSPIKVICCQLL